MNEDTILYEIGFHFAPSLSESEVTKAVETLKGYIAEVSGKVTAEEKPQLMSLAYPIPRRSDAGISHFDKAHFGWIKFEIEPASVEKVYSRVKAMPEVLRFLLVKTDVGNTIQYHKPERKVQSVESTEMVAGSEIQEEKVVEKAFEAEIDKSIDELVV